jgi:(1->4)-alpha-D-glucan 1-alpha-D-glucosylmutase
LENFVQRILPTARINSLAQTLLKYTAPGVPDTYQGSEVWDLHLVDPDNRGPVDYTLRQSMLAELEQGMDAAEILKRMDCGLPKLWVISKALELRREHPEWFGRDAAYTPLAAAGPKKEHAIAYLRGNRVATLISRWNMKLGGNWSATTVELPSGRWQNVLTGEDVQGGRLRVQLLLQRFPVALLVNQAE